MKSVWPVLLILLLTIHSKADDNDGIESEDGDAAKFYNMTYREQQSALEKKIFYNYRNNRRPVRNVSQPTTVSMHWHVIHVSVNANEQTMTLHGHLYMSWFDEFLVWDPKDFNGVRTARCKKWQVWQPKVRVINSVSGVNSLFEISTQGHALLEMQPDNRAKVEIYPTFSIKVGCLMDFSDFPNDVNKCNVAVFTTEPMSQVQINIYYALPPSLSFAWGDQSKKRIISDFNVVNITNNVVYYSEGNYTELAPIVENELSQTWTMVMTTVVFSRHSPFFFAGVFLPNIIGTLMCVLPFFIDSCAFASFTLVSNMIILSIFLQDAFSKFPLATKGVPKSLIYYDVLLISTTVALLIHIVVMFATAARFPLPDCLNPRPFF
ncbi:unnamed protein product [Caenorhabditis auriculariae]|uniref:Neurotransmitter-gated ion-channel ligand-binding domain-containing protein n=1 Tax=Caenorhabditis auriculariae TaxID=2777116 RepID=A0A8S1H1K8_9PELO|nr:unnamed protein product [Caenorhabditis auriculariae]